MYVFVGLPLADHTTSSGPSLVDRILPVFDPDQPSKNRMKVIGHISCSINALHVGLAVLINYYAILDFHSATSHDITNRRNPTAPNHPPTYKPPATPPPPSPHPTRTC